MPGSKEEDGAGREQQAALLPFLVALARQHAAQQPAEDNVDDDDAHGLIEADHDAGHGEPSGQADDDDEHDHGRGMEHQPDFGAPTAGSATDDGGDGQSTDRDADADKDEPLDDDAEMASVDDAVAPGSAPRRSPSFVPASPAALVVPLSTPANAPSRPAAPPTPSSSSASSVGKRPAAVSLLQGSPTPVHGTRSSDEAAAAARTASTSALGARPSTATQLSSPRRSPSSVSLSQAEAAPSGPSQSLTQPTVPRQATAGRSSSSSSADPSRPSPTHSALEPTVAAGGPASSASSSPATAAAGAALSASQAPLNAAAASSPAQAAAIPSAQAQTRPAVDGSEPIAPSSSAPRPLQVHITSPAGASSSQAAPGGASADRPSSGHSSNPVVVGAGPRRTPPPPPVVHSSQSAAAAGPSQPARSRPRVFPHQMTPWFYYQTSIRNLLRPDEPPYDRLRKLSIRAELLLGWRPLLIDRLERVADGRPASGAALDPVVWRALKDTLSLLRTDEQNADVVDFVREWVSRRFRLPELPRRRAEADRLFALTRPQLVKSQLAIDPSSSMTRPPGSSSATSSAPRRPRRRPVPRTGALRPLPPPSTSSYSSTGRDPSTSASSSPSSPSLPRADFR